MLQQQMQAVPFLVRFRYKPLAEYIVSLLDPRIVRYKTLSQEAIADHAEHVIQKLMLVESLWARARAEGRGPLSWVFPQLPRPTRRRNPRARAAHCYRLNQPAYMESAHMPSLSTGSQQGRSEEDAGRDRWRWGREGGYVEQRQVQRKLVRGATLRQRC